MKVNHMKNIFATAASVLVLGFAMPAMAQSNTSNAYQTGTSNNVDVEQLGFVAKNTSTIKQGQYNGGSAENSARVLQKGKLGIKNDSTITQDGYRNTATALQGGENEFFTRPVDMNDSIITQNGDRNQAVVKQGEIDTNNVSRVDQGGNDHIARVTQGGERGDSSDVTAPNQQGDNRGPNQSYITQRGNGHEAYVEQGGAGAVNYSEIGQDDGFVVGGNNWAKVEQGGSSDNESHLFQHGAYNTATVTQNSAFGVTNDSTLSQTGYGNGATINQH
jgi:hypothetical protein